MLTPSASASAGTWSSARRRLPDSRRLSVEMSICARAATAPASGRVRCAARAAAGGHGCRGRLPIQQHNLAQAHAMRNRRGMTYDSIVIGGGAAGLSAALVLGRARKRTLLVDAGDQSNLPAHAIGGLLGQDGRSPADFYAQGRAQLEPHTSVELREDEVTGAHRDNGHFALELASGETHETRRIVLATGMEYRRPQIPGLEPLWGDSVFHCPFCHGWEVRDQPIAVLADGEKAGHLMHMLPNWSDDVVLLDPNRPITATHCRERQAHGDRVRGRRDAAALRAPGRRQLSSALRPPRAARRHPHRPWLPDRRCEPRDDRAGRLRGGRCHGPAAGRRERDRLRVHGCRDDRAGGIGSRRCRAPSKSWSSPSSNTSTRS